MRTTVFAAALSAITASFAPVGATADVLVELFTSQGCSSCPPADKLLADLAKRDGVIALSLHVDYWDYLGWADSFASPEYTNRQKAYAKASGATMIYTPQMMIGGTHGVVGTRAMEVADAMTVHSAKVPRVSLAAKAAGARAEISASAINGATLPERMVVHLVRYTPNATVKIERGENAGRQITYHNIVQSWTEVAVWDGGSPLSIDAPLDGDTPGVVIVQDGASGPILAAVRID